jgi:hypothetical protein
VWGCTFRILLEASCIVATLSWNISRRFCWRWRSVCRGELDRERERPLSLDACRRGERERERERRGLPAGGAPSRRGERG